MNKTEFEHRLLLYGSRLERWPPEDAQAAQHLLSHDASARALLDEARDLDLKLSQAVASDAVGSALTGQVLANVRNRAHRPRFLRLPNWRIASAGAIVTGTAVAGFALGLLVAGLSSMTSDAMLMSIAGADAGNWLLQ